jgi:peptidoglycan biosynthesis protein MviN/MurJ (putative lipid II flippase)
MQAVDKETSSEGNSSGDDRMKKPGLRRQMVLTMTVSGLAFLAGFWKLKLIAQLFGVSADLDGYYLALTLPGLVSGIIAGVMQTGFFPMRARLASLEDASEVERFERAALMIGALLGVLVALALALGLFAILAVAPPQSASWRSAVYVLPYALALIPLNAVGNALGALLAFRGRYHWFAAAPIANALFSAGLLAIWPEGGLFNLAAGTMLGLALQVGLCAWALKKLGGFRFMGPWRGAARKCREMLQQGSWMLPGLPFTELTANLPTVLAASHGEGAAAAFGYAWRFQAYAIQLLVMAASPILLARFSELLARNDWAAVRAALRKSAWISALLGIMAILGIGLFGEMFLSLFFGGNTDAVHAVAQQWLVLALAIGPTVHCIVCAKVLQANGNARFLSAITIAAFFAFLTVAMTSSGKLGVYAVSVALVIHAFFVLVFDVQKLSKLPVRGKNSAD